MWKYDPKSSRIYYLGEPKTYKNGEFPDGNYDLKTEAGKEIITPKK